MAFEVPKGMHIYRAIESAILHAGTTGGSVHFDFNDIRLTVYPASCAMDIAAIYSLKAQLQRLGVPVNA